MGAFDVSTAWRGAASLYKDALRDLINLNDVNCIVEIGVDCGFSFFTLAKDFPNAVVIGIDAYTQYGSAEQAKSHVLAHIGEFKNARLIIADSIVTSKSWRQPENYLDIDILHIDGDHMFDSVKSDFEAWNDYVMIGGAIMFHDINAFPNDVGRFFDSLSGKKIKLEPNGPGLGIWIKE